MTLIRRGIYSVGLAGRFEVFWTNHVRYQHLNKFKLNLGQGQGSTSGICPYPATLNISRSQVIS